jgi:nitric oxide reductase subunit C
MELLKILSSSLVLIAGFVGFATFGIPLVIPELPPVEEKITGAMTKDQYIAMGSKIFLGKGTCTLCHSPVGGRAPLLDTVGARAAERIKDPRYKGKAKTSEEYIHESMLEPSTYVVAGFGKPGTNDTVSPMPQIDKGAIGLNPVEIGAVISYLQSIAGVDVTVALPTGEAAPAAGASAEPAKVVPAKTLAEAVKKFECLTCHAIPGVPDGGDLGPPLTSLKADAGKRKKGLSAEQYIQESIISPNAFIVKGFEPDVMPGDLAERITVAELNVIINGLLGKEAGKEGGK